MNDFVLYHGNELNITSEHTDYYKFENSSSVLFTKRKPLIIQSNKHILYIIGSISCNSNFLTQHLTNKADCDNIRGRYVIIKIHENGLVSCWADEFSRMDVYFAKSPNLLTIGSNLSYFGAAANNSKLDEIGIIHSLFVYGSRPAKKHTIYSEIHRLGVNETLLIKQNDFELSRSEPNLYDTKDYSDNDLKVYRDLFLRAIETRSSRNHNVVYLSSGWDSTSILAGLRHMYNKSDITCIIGRMRYSNQSGVINQFEIDRAKKFAEYYGVDLEVVDLNYIEGAACTYEEIKDLYRHHCFSNMTGFNHWLLAKKTSQLGFKDIPVFAGEFSDGVHNLGFSQYVTKYHPDSRDYREYADKMLGYLHGPTFFNSVKCGRYEKDPVWQFFNLNTEINLDGNIELMFLSSFFLRQDRLPYVDQIKSKLIKPNALANYISVSENVYLSQYAKKLTPENLYSILIHLYNSFHWQGSTVSTLEYSADQFNLNAALPFGDKELIKFLSQMPESWGRGLDLNNTKYPLKQILRNELDYPYDYQIGPHSYTYDVQPNFSLVSELVNNSGLTQLLKTAVTQNLFFRDELSQTLEIDYIDLLISRYQKDEILEGSDLNDLYTIGMLALIGRI